MNLTLFIVFGIIILYPEILNTERGFQMEILVIAGAVSLMVLGASLVVLGNAFIIYKTDPTYTEFGFWGNLRMELSTLLAGKFGYEVARQVSKRDYELGLDHGFALNKSIRDAWDKADLDKSLEGSMSRHPANKK
jgi:hypothetical protein